MENWIVKCAVGALAVVAVGCSGRETLLTTASGGSGNGAGSGGDSGGTFSGAGSGGSANPNIANDAGAAGTDIGVAGSGGSAPTLPPVQGWVAYDADLFAEGHPGRHIHLIAADGSCKRPLTEGDEIEKQPAFSADGKRIAFASNRTGTFQIFAMELATGERTQLTNVAEGATYPSWSPDGKAVAFVTADAEADLNAKNQVMRVDTSTLETSPLTELNRIFTRSTFASNDLLLVTGMSSIIGVVPDTLEQNELVPFNGRIPSPNSPSVGPDGAYYAFSDLCGGEFGLFIARVDGKTGDTCANALRLARYAGINTDSSAPESDVDYGPRTASWGSTGYVASETYKHDIILVASDGSDDVRVLVDSSAPVHNPVFAPATADFSCQD